MQKCINPSHLHCYLAAIFTISLCIKVSLHTQPNPMDPQDEKKRLESLLAWSISNSDPQVLQEMRKDIQASSEKIASCDPDLINHILGYDTKQEQESQITILLSQILSNEFTLPERKQAMEDLCDIVESDSNACFDFAPSWPLIVNFLALLSCKNNDLNAEATSELVPFFCKRILKEIMSNNLPILNQFHQAKGMNCLIELLKEVLSFELSKVLLSLLGVFLTASESFVCEAQTLRVEVVLLSLNQREERLGRDIYLLFQFWKEAYGVELQSETREFIAAFKPE